MSSSHRQTTAIDQGGGPVGTEVPKAWRYDHINASAGVGAVRRVSSGNSSWRSARTIQASRG